MKPILERITVIIPLVILFAIIVMIAKGLIEHWLSPTDFEQPVVFSYRGTVWEAMINTLVIVGLAAGLAVLPSLTCAVMFLELSQRNDKTSGISASAIRKLMEIGASLPRLVWGVAGAAMFGDVFGFGVSVATGVIALGCMMAPIMFNGFLDGLLTADRIYRPQLAALGINPRRAMRHVQFAAARPALIAAMTLAIGRGLGDAAVLLLTAGISFTILNGFDAPASSLAVQIYVQTLDVGGGGADAMLAAAVLLILIFIIQSITAGLHQMGGCSRIRNLANLS